LSVPAKAGTNPLAVPAMGALAGVLAALPLALLGFFLLKKKGSSRSRTLRRHAKDWKPAQIE